MNDIFFITFYFVASYKNSVVLFSDIMTVIKHFKVDFINNFLGYKLMHVKYICATAAKSLICSAEGGAGAVH